MKYIIVKNIRHGIKKIKGEEKYHIVNITTL